MQQSPTAGGERSEAAIRAAIAAVPHWYHRIELAPGIVTPGINDCAHVLGLLDLPADLRGKRVLDLGTRDGYFAFVCEQRGADVLAVDYMPAASTGFAVAAELLGSRVPYRCDNLYNLDPATIGQFDIVLMLGLLYHLRDPLGALDIVRDLCRDRLYLETHCCDEFFLLSDGTSVPLRAIDPRLAAVPFAQFNRGSSLNADPTNFWSPNVACVDALLKEALFAVEASLTFGNRALFHARITDDGEARYHRDIASGARPPRTDG